MGHGGAWLHITVSLKPTAPRRWLADRHATGRTGGGNAWRRWPTWKACLAFPPSRGGRPPTAVAPAAAAPPAVVARSRSGSGRRHSRPDREGIPHSHRHLPTTAIQSGRPGRRPRWRCRHDPPPSPRPTTVPALYHRRRALPLATGRRDSTAWFRNRAATWGYARKRFPSRSPGIDTHETGVQSDPSKSAFLHPRNRSDTSPLPPVPLIPRKEIPV